jgi:hypothetical protein
MCLSQSLMMSYDENSLRFSLKYTDKSILLTGCEDVQCQISDHCYKGCERTKCRHARLEMNNVHYK